MGQRIRLAAANLRPKDLPSGVSRPRELGSRRVIRGYGSEALGSGRIAHGKPGLTGAWSRRRCTGREERSNVAGAGSCRADPKIGAGVVCLWRFAAIHIAVDLDHSGCGKHVRPLRWRCPRARNQGKDRKDSHKTRYRRPNHAQVNTAAPVNWQAPRGVAK